MESSGTWVVITTINRPTDAVKAIARLAAERQWRLVVVGDLSTPADWSLGAATYLSIEQQHHRFGELSRLIPLRHYSRKNLGYLYAIQEGADRVLETDDDNIPYDSFGNSQQREVVGKVLGGAPWINVYAHFTSSLIWPRGLPLTAIHVPGTISSSDGRAVCPIQQHLADNDPDVDAIWRLLFKQLVVFDRGRGPIIVDSGSYVPFNSQNTTFFREAFPLLYLPCYANFRMTDIWRSIVAQRVMWASGARLCFHEPSVEQVRNSHDLMADFEDEISGYLKNREIAGRLDALPLESMQGMTGRAVACWDVLMQMGLLPEKERRILLAWLNAF